MKISALNSKMIEQWMINLRQASSRAITFCSRININFSFFSCLLKVSLFVKYKLRKLTKLISDLEFVKYFTPVSVAVRFKKKVKNRKLRMKDVFLTYFKQIVSCCAIIYSNTNSLQLLCENSSLNSANFTDYLR